MNNHWINDAVIYHLYPLGLTGAPHTAGEDEPVVNRLDRLREWLPHIRALGADTLLLGPVFASDTHGYDTRDYFRIDPRLGSNEDFAAFCREARGQGFRIVLDGVFHHVGRGHAQFRDLQQANAASDAKEWFAGVDFRGRSPYGDPFSYDGWNGHHNLVKLNLENPQVREYLFDAVRFWINEFRIDGLRLDAADSLPQHFMRELAGVCRSERPDFWLMGEVIHGDYREWTDGAGLDATTNYECYKGLWSAHNDRNYHEIAWSLNRLFGPEGIYRHLHLCNFADNHDVSRIGSVLREYRHIHPLHILLFTMPGVPALYYGSEWGLPGEKRDTDDWNLRPALSSDEERRRGDRDLEETIRRLIRLRRECAPLRNGSYRQLDVGITGETLLFARENGEGVTMIAVNSGDQPFLLRAGEHFPGKRFRDILNGNREYGPDEEITVHPAWGSILAVG